MSTFRNRIIEYGVKPASEFLANPKNARLHPQFQRDVMKSALETVGFVAPVIEAKSGYLLDGHERIWQAMNNNDADVPFVVVDVDESEEDYILLTFDPITGLATYDAENLESLLHSVNSDSAAVQAMLAKLAGLEQDPYELWQGMPEFEQDDLTAFKTIQVHFNTQADVDAFSQLVRQQITDKTKYIYYPEVEDVNLKPYRTIDES